MVAEQTKVLEFEDESDELDVAEQLPPGSTAAVVTGTDCKIHRKTLLF